MGVCGEDRPRSPDRLPAGGRQAPSALCSVSSWPRVRHPGRAAVQGVGRAGRSPFQDQDQHPAPRCVPRSGLRPQALCGSHVVPTLGRGRTRRLGTGTCWVHSPGGDAGPGHGPLACTAARARGAASRPRHRRAFARAVARLLVSAELARASELKSWPQVSFSLWQGKERPDALRVPRPAGRRRFGPDTGRGDSRVRSWELWAHGQQPASPGPDGSAAGRALQGQGTRKEPRKSVSRAGHGARSLRDTRSSPAQVPPLAPYNETWTDMNPKAQTRHVTSPKSRDVHGSQIPGRRDSQ